MEMQVRGWWREERTIWTRDTMGRAVPVSTGLTKDPDGRLVAVIAIGDGPSAIIGRGDDSVRSDLEQNIAATLEARADARKSGQ